MSTKSLHVAAVLLIVFAALGPMLWLEQHLPRLELAMLAHARTAVPPTGSPGTASRFPEAGLAFETSHAFSFRNQAIG